MVDGLPSMHEALVSIPAPGEKNPAVPSLSETLPDTSFLLNPNSANYVKAPYQILPSFRKASLTSPVPDDPSFS